MNDNQLIAQLKKRDRNTLKDVYREYKTDFFRFALRYTKDDIALKDIYEDEGAN